MRVNDKTLMWHILFQLRRINNAKIMHIKPAFLLPNKLDFHELPGKLKMLSLFPFILNHTILIVLPGMLFKKYYIIFTSRLESRL